MLWTSGPGLWGSRQSNRLPTAQRALSPGESHADFPSQIPFPPNKNKITSLELQWEFCKKVASISPVWFFFNKSVLLKWPMIVEILPRVKCTVVSSSDSAKNKQTTKQTNNNGHKRFRNTWNVWGLSDCVLERWADWGSPCSHDDVYCSSKEQGED